jgi:hypothetical protein
MGRMKSQNPMAGFDVYQQLLMDRLSAFVKDSRFRVVREPAEEFFGKDSIQRKAPE